MKTFKIICFICGKGGREYGVEDLVGISWVQLAGPGGDFTETISHAVHTGTCFDVAEEKAIKAEHPYGHDGVDLSTYA